VSQALADKFTQRQTIWFCLSPFSKQKPSRM